MKFEVSLELIEEMAECIGDCNWSSSEEIYAYMKGCVTGTDDYDPEEWINNNTKEITIEQRGKVI